jgi:CRP-like cAMP-binding protein
LLESGRVVLGVMAGDVMEHQLGVLEGPCWLEASSAVLDLPPAVDALADTDVVLRRVPVAEFGRILADLSVPARAVLDDVARAHRQQTELAVSRLAKDAEARCAEWLLQHAAPLAQGGAWRCSCKNANVRLLHSWASPQRRCHGCCATCVSAA